MDLDFIPVRQPAPSSNNDKTNKSNFSLPPPADQLNLSYAPNPLHTPSIYANYSLFQSKLSQRMSAIHQLAQHDAQLGMKFNPNANFTPSTSFSLIESLQQQPLPDFNYTELSEPPSLGILLNNFLSQPLNHENLSGRNSQHSRASSREGNLSARTAKLQQTAARNHSQGKENVRSTANLRPQPQSTNPKLIKAARPLEKQEFRAEIEIKQPVQTPAAEIKAESQTHYALPLQPGPPTAKSGGKSGKTGAWQSVSQSELEEQQKIADKLVKQQRREELQALKHNKLAKQGKIQPKPSKIPLKTTLNVYNEQKSTQLQPIASKNVLPVSTLRETASIPASQSISVAKGSVHPLIADLVGSELRGLLEKEVSRAAQINLEYEKEEKLLAQERAYRLYKLLGPERSEAQENQPKSDNLSQEKPLSSAEKPQKEGIPLISVQESKASVEHHIEALSERVLDDLVGETAREIARIEQENEEIELQRKQIEQEKELRELLAEYESQQEQIRQKSVQRQRESQQNSSISIQISRSSSLPRPTKFILGEDSLPGEFVEELGDFVMENRKKAERMTLELLARFGVVKGKFTDILGQCEEWIVDKILTEISGELHGFVDGLVDSIVQSEINPTQQR
jgi:hypothetical protein